MCSLCALPIERTAFCFTPSASSFSLTHMVLLENKKLKKKLVLRWSSNSQTRSYLCGGTSNPDCPVISEIHWVEPTDLTFSDPLHLRPERPNELLFTLWCPQTFTPRRRQLSTGFVAKRCLWPWSWNQITAARALISPSVCSEWKVACHFLPRSPAF